MRITNGLRAFAAAGVLLWATGTLSAHPLATVEVGLTIRPDATLAADILTDGDVLIAKLEALAGLPAGPAAGSLAGRRARLEQLAATLTSHVDVRCDGRPVALQLSGVSSASDGRVVVHLIGVASSSTSQVAWRTSLIYGSYPLVVHRPDDDASGRAAPIEWIQGGESSRQYPMAAPAGGHWSGWRGFALGYTHILPNGLDHILFVLGLYLLNPRPRAVLAQVSAFTIAHSITLGLSLYGVVSLPSRVVEPMIALSIAYVAIENIFATRVRSWRIALVFGFGLLHGLGFAEALANLHLPRAEFFSTLVTFNAGVEAGQLTVIAAAAAAVGACRLSPSTYQRWVLRPASGAIALAGLFWMIARLI